MKKMYKSIKGFFVTAISVMLLCIGIMAAGTPVYAADDTAIQLDLNSKSNTDNVSFQVENMFPGDVVLNKYIVQVSYQDVVTVHFRAEVLKGYEKLAEVLQCKVALVDTGEQLYNGLMKDMPNSVDYTLTAEKNASANVCYEITAWLDTKVGNEYQEKSLLADFVWWVEETENLTPPESEDILDILPDEVVDMFPEGVVGALTGDNSGIILWLVLTLFVAAVLGFFVITRKRTKTGKRMMRSVVLTIILVAGFTVVSYAMIRNLLTVETNSFQTGRVCINFNDDEPVIEEEEYRFEPGMTVVKDFFIENESTIDVYYKIYLENVEGKLADILDVTLKEGDNVLYHGKAADMTETNVNSPDDVLQIGEVRWLNISFYYPCDGENDGQGEEMSFDISAEAVQTVNNPDREFN